ncbi:MAG: hypothetical protein ABH883_00050 [Candidatus Omnitrophota bacterium]
MTEDRDILRKRVFYNAIFTGGEIMGLRDRNRLKNAQKNKRHKKRLKLKEKGLDPADFFSGKFFVGQTEDSKRD